MTDAFQLIRKHRGNGLLIDTNLLLLYLVGKTNPGRIANFKRTSRYTVEDFDLLGQIVEQFRTLVTTPHVLTELSNLRDLQGEERPAFRSGFLGLTDAAIASLSRHSYLFLTDDLNLYLTLLERGVDAINFSYLQQLRWTL
jgi:hypothetical protein